MSNDFKNKMYDYEVIPPVNVWDNIVHSLDDEIIQRNLSDKLYNNEATPPLTAWNKITVELDQTLYLNKFRDEVISLEVQPPTHTWDAISLQLNEASHEGFSKKIYDYEVAPPANTWKKILTFLDTEQTVTPVIPLRINYNKIIRIAAAAAIIGIIAWAGFSLKKNENFPAQEIANKDTKITKPAVPSIKPTGVSSGEIIKETITIPQDNAAIALIPPVKTNLKKNVKTSSNNTLEIISSSFEENHSTSNDIAVADTKSLHSKNKAISSAATDITTEARYLVYLTDEGTMVKLSKKLADLTCIYTKDGSISQDALAGIDASECNDRVKYWQGKMANSSLQSSSNPFELMEILK